MDDLFNDLPPWFRVLWVIASAVSISLVLVLIWAIIQVVLYLIG